MGEAERGIDDLREAVRSLESSVCGVTTVLQRLIEKAVDVQPRQATVDSAELLADAEAREGVSISEIAAEWAAKAHRWGKPTAADIAMTRQALLDDLRNTHFRALNCGDPTPVAVLGEMIFAILRYAIASGIGTLDLLRATRTASRLPTR